MAQAQTEWNREKIANLLATSDKAVERALVVVFNNQEADEQAIDSTHKANGVGFTAFDANIFSSFAKQVLNGRTLSVKQMVIARKPDKFGNMKIARYWKQLQAEIIRKKNTKVEFTYEDDLYSDLFKDANGFRPGGILWDRWVAMSPVEKQKEWNRLQKEIEVQIFNINKGTSPFIIPTKNKGSGNWNSTNGKRNLNEWE